MVMEILDNHTIPVVKRRKFESFSRLAVLRKKAGVGCPASST